MNATWEVFNKELRDAYHGGKVAAGLLLLGLVIPVATLALLQPWLERLQQTTNVANLLRLEEPAPPYSGVRFHGLRLPAVTEIFNQGVTSDFPSEFSLPRYALADPTAQRAADRPLLGALPANDLRFVFQLVFPLLAIVLSFSTVSGEAEIGTLALLCSHPIMKRSVILGKMLAGATLLEALLLLAHLLATVTIIVSGVSLPRGFALFLGWHFLATSLWTLFFFLMGTLASVATLSSNQSAILMLAAWALLVLVLPSALPTLVTSASRYQSEQQQYENAWPYAAQIFEGAQDLVSGLGFSFSRGLTRHFARQPTWSEVAVQLRSSSKDAELFCQSDGTVVVRTQDGGVLEGMESRLPAYLRRQTEVGRRIFEIRFQRFLSLYRESLRMDRWTAVFPVMAYNQITSSLAGDDAEGYLEFIQELNRRKEGFFLSLEALSDFSTRRFFTMPKQGDKATSGLGPPLWEGSSGHVPASGRSMTGAWLWLLVEDLILALAATGLFLRLEVR